MIVCTIWTRICLCGKTWKGRKCHPQSQVGVAHVSPFVSQYSSPLWKIVFNPLGELSQSSKGHFLLFATPSFKAVWYTNTWQDTFCATSREIKTRILRKSESIYLELLAVFAVFWWPRARIPCGAAMNGRTFEHYSFEISSHRRFFLLRTHLRWRTLVYFWLQPCELFGVMRENKGATSTLEILRRRLSCSGESHVSATVTDHA